MSIERGEVVRRWAEQKYNVEGVTGVEFMDEHDPGYSDYTPGIGDYIRVVVYGFADCVLGVADAYEALSLIVDICQFADKHRELPA